VFDRPEVEPWPAWEQKDDGLHIKATRTKRIYNELDWPNPVVLKITSVQPVKRL
jgi:hypothetical protein